MQTQCSVRRGKECTTACLDLLRFDNRLNTARSGTCASGREKAQGGGKQRLVVRGYN